MNNTSDNNDAPLGPHLIRITSGGKIRAWVEFALDFFQKNSDRPLVLHTLPTMAQSSEQPPEMSTAPDLVPVQKVTRLPSCTATVPRLISVAEIIKREYLKALPINHPMQLSGLHQYNEVGCLEDFGLAQMPLPQEDRATAVAAALEGKTYARENQTPFMKITLCPKALPDLIDKGATYQLPAMRRLSRSAKARARKKQKGLQKEKETGIIDNIT